MDSCTGCAICVTECPQRAIGTNDAGEYIIDRQLCNDCKNIPYIECIRVCDYNAITYDNGTHPEIDPTWRVRPEHLIWMMAVIASRGVQDETKYMVGHPQYDQKRRLASAALLDPDLKIRLTRSFDDICIKCPAKQEPGHSEVSGKVDDMCFEEMGIEANAEMRLWDAVKLIEEKFSLSFIKSLTPIPDDILKDFLCFLSPDAKALHTS